MQKWTDFERNYNKSGVLMSKKTQIECEMGLNIQLDNFDFNPKDSQYPTRITSGY